MHSDVNQCTQLIFVSDLLSDTLHKAVTTHQAAVNEFLRQYWAAIAHEPERAKRMLDSIEKLEDRKAELEQEAEKDTPGEGRQRIQMVSCSLPSCLALMSIAEPPSHSDSCAYGASSAESIAYRHYKCDCSMIRNTCC